MRWIEKMALLSQGPSARVAVYSPTGVTEEVQKLEPVVPKLARANVKRNSLCPCGSKIKYKRCHGK